MRCPYCGHQRDKVVDSRESKEGGAIRRRRQCRGCGRRFTSYERIEEIPYMVIKKGGSRERFDRSKVMAGLLKACEKRPVAVHQLEQIVEDIERQLHEAPEREIPTGEIGQRLMERLRRIDKVAYVRFASVYLDFKDVREFTREIEHLS
jgi:transcriptional repressor NrdR